MNTHPTFPKSDKESVLIQQPIFLVGAERSGTTVLRLMLKHHPLIAWRNEFEYVVDQLPPQDGWPDLDKYYNWLEVHRIFSRTNLLIDKSLSYPELVNSFLVQHRERWQRPIVGATVHRHFDRLLRIWPDAKFIYILRDGRDVARSNIGMGWAGNVWTGVEKWIEVEALWQQMKEFVSPENRMEMTYENLICNPVDVLNQVCQFIGVSYDDAMLAYADNTSYEYPDPKYIAQWRHKLSEYEIRLAEARIAPQLQANGYELSGKPPLKITPLKIQSLKFQDKLARLQFRVKRFGFGLLWTNFWARKLGLKRLEKQTQLQINEIQVKLLK